MEVAPGTIAVWSDLHCPWSHVAVWRLHDARRRLGLSETVRFDHRVFPLELFNSEPTPFRTVSAEVPVCAQLAPRAGWQIWQGPLTAWPVTTLLPMEAVQAAKDQGLAASEELDRALRVAFFGESRCISLRHVVLEIASACEGVDVAALAAALDEGRARARIAADWRVASGDAVRGSPHLFVADGGDWHNPGTRMHWEGSEGIGFPVVDADDPSVYEEIVRRAVG
ncbi:MAG TPA: DsbA family protein [Candidatus Limnocylindria bacterium]|nr:DsbA family protein [Candidatus Limnocylindria bacterium]